MDIPEIRSAWVTMDPMRKTATVKNVTGEGTVEAVIATLGVKDSDGDVTLPGFFGVQHPAIVQAHNWHDVMLGKGTLVEEDDEAVFRGEFNLDDPDAEKLHSKLLFDLGNPPAQIEWSYSLELKQGAREQFFDHPEHGDGWWLQPVDGQPGVHVAEVSPVLRGAGIDTRTIDAKSRFSDQINDVLNAVEAVAERAAAIQDLRPIGEKTRVRLGELVESLTKLAADADEKEDLGIVMPSEATSEWVRYQKTISKVRELSRTLT